MPHGKPERVGGPSFSWGAGIENTFVLEPDPKTGKTLDEYELTNHYQHWRQDLDNVESLGVDWVRWGVPWFKVNPAPGVWDWSWTDQVFAWFDEHHVSPIVDFVHYGTPRWMPRAFLEPDYPARVAEYADRLTERYGRGIRAATPCNEPFTAAEWSSKVSNWPPSVPGDAGFVRVMMALAEGAVTCAPVLTRRGIQSVQVEVAGGAVAGDEASRAAVEFENARCLLYWDLLTGKIDKDHLLFPWLVKNGASPERIGAIAAARAPIDLLGVNYYPQWSYKLYKTSGGKMQVLDLAGTDLFTPLLKTLADRYSLPLMITETSWRGSPEEKSEWLKRSVADIDALRASGVDIRGYIWFPVLEMVDWKYRTEPGTLLDHRLNLGFWDLDRHENPAAQAYRDTIKKHSSS